MALKDYSDSEAVRSRGQDLVSISLSFFFSFELRLLSTHFFAFCMGFSMTFFLFVLFCMGSV